jgi:hypothetical protein
MGSGTGSDGVSTRRSRSHIPGRPVSLQGPRTATTRTETSRTRTETTRTETTRTETTRTETTAGPVHQDATRTSVLGHVLGHVLGVVAATIDVHVGRDHGHTGRLPVAAVIAVHVGRGHGHHTGRLLVAATDIHVGRGRGQGLGRPLVVVAATTDGHVGRGLGRQGATGTAGGPGRPTGHVLVAIDGHVGRDYRHGDMNRRERPAPKRNQQEHSTLSRSGRFNTPRSVNRCVQTWTCQSPWSGSLTPLHPEHT